MESIKFSKVALTAGMNQVIGTSLGLSTTIGGTNSNTFIRIYKGTQLTSAQLNSATTLASIDSMVSGVGGGLLITNTMPNAAGSTTNNTARIVDSDYVSAIAGGVASWFLVWSGSNSNLASSSSVTIYNSFMGTISDALGTGDLRLTSTSIVQNNQYRVNALNLSIPFEFNF